MKSTLEAGERRMESDGGIARDMKNMLKVIIW
jgi:hypothetical protein